MIYLLDTSAVLIHYRQEPGSERVLCLFDDPASVVLLSNSAQQRGACLVHRDGHFRAIPVALLRTIDLTPSDKNPRAPVDQSVVR